MWSLFRYKILMNHSIMKKKQWSNKLRNLEQKLVLIQQYSSVQFSHSVMSNSLWLHGLQHTRLPYPSPTPGACSNSCPSSRWCHPAISSSVIPFSSCFQSFPASESFPVSQFFGSGGQNIGGLIFLIVCKCIFYKKT